MNFFKKKILDSHNDHSIVAIADGNLVALKNVPDDVFSKKILGDGVAIQISSQKIMVPGNGTIDMIYPHAFGMTLQNGIQILVHVGLNTVSLNGEGFQQLAKKGSKVKKGDVIIKLDKSLIERKGFNLITMIIVTETNGYNFIFHTKGKVIGGKSVIAEF